LLKKPFFIFAILALAVLCCGRASGQQISTKAYFLKDSVKIGEEVPFVLSATYPNALNVLFPDSTFDFSPFEYARKAYFPTRSDSAMSTDSAVYYLATFEIESVQKLSMPVYVVRSGDSTAIYARPDSVYLIELVTDAELQTEPTENTEYVEVETETNYPLLAAIVGVVLLIAILVAVFFGKNILRAYRRRRMARLHKRFTERFAALVNEASGERPARKPEFVLNVWKQYVEGLDKMPLTKMTTKEIVKVYDDAELRERLRHLDRVIYGGERSNALVADFDYLGQFASARYQHKMQEDE
jgi:hypothetical protein